MQPGSGIDAKVAIGYEKSPFTKLKPNERNVGRSPISREARCRKIDEAFIINFSCFLGNFERKMSFSNLIHK